MLSPPFDLAQARILVSNDDGIVAPGLAVLADAARSLSADVWVVAPEQEQSGAGHSLTLQRPLRIRQVADRHYAVDGTPTDCVLLAVHEILKDHKPTLILSGVNYGGNMGEDVTYSGTVAAAMEGTLLGIPSIAFSLAVVHGETPLWQTPRGLIPDLIRNLAAHQWPTGCLMNVNIPNREPAAITGVRAAAQGMRKLGDNLVKSVDPRGKTYYWIGPVRDEDATKPGTDLNAVTEGAVAVTPISLDLTHVAGLSALAGYLP